MNYEPPFLYRGSHFSTIIPNIMRPLARVNYERITIDTLDGDFIDVDLRYSTSKRAVLLLHGLEGSSQSRYMVGIGNVLSANGFNIIAMNYRGCSGRENRKAQSYHSGNTADVITVLNAFHHQFESIDLIGFSLGGNIALKLAGEFPDHEHFSKVVSVSAPIDLNGCAKALARTNNLIYLARFFGSLKQKAIKKSREHPSLELSETDIKKSKSFEEFDEFYTAPVHGFESAQDYYNKSSALHVLDAIKTPALLINARNDTFLSASCYPELGDESKVQSLYPSFGGHVGFASDLRMKGPFWHEKRILEFLLA